MAEDTETEVATQVVKASDDRKKPRIYKSECYMVAIDDIWFLAKDDWTEHPTFGKKYSRAKVADGNADDEQSRHPNKKIRIVKAVQTIKIYEI